MADAPRSRWRIFLGAGALLGLHATLALWAVARHSITVDEIFHVTGGYIFNRFGDYRIHPDNGVLPQRLHALPAVLAGAQPPPLANNEYWTTADVPVVSYQFFYESGNDHWPILMGARAVNVLFAAGIGALVFAWARRLAGDLAGFVALALATLSPTLLAHGPIATTDAAAAFFLTASVGAFWRQLAEPDWKKLLLSAATFGLACVTKYSAALLLPIFAVLIAIHAARAEKGRRRPGWLAASVGVHVVAAWAIIWACFGFRYSAFAPGVPGGHFIRVWDPMLEQMGLQGSVLRLLREARLLPEAFLFGYTHTYVGSLSRAAFLAGDYSVTGWPWFFPLAFLWKSTLAELAGVALAASAMIVAVRGRRLGAAALRIAPLLALLAIYGVVAVRSHLNIGQRHLLPMYPALFILAGVAVARLPWRPRVAALAAGALIALQAAAAVAVFPSYLSYFNALAGGPANGWRLLVDSSLDWGQDLPALKAWLERNAREPDAPRVYLSYFGSGKPSYYDIRADRMLFVSGFKFRQPWYEPKGGIYCISATMLQEVYSPANGPWTPALEKEYQDLRRVEPQFRQYHLEPAAKPALLALVPEAQWDRAWHRYETLRHARLCAYLRARGPDAMAGYSILIFRVSDAEIAAALHSSYSAWQRAVSEAASRGRR